LPKNRFKSPKIYADQAGLPMGAPHMDTTNNLKIPFFMVPWRRLLQEAAGSESNLTPSSGNSSDILPANFHSTISFILYYNAVNLYNQ